MSMNRKQKKMLRRILLSAALMVLLHFVPVTGWLRAVLYLLPYGLVGYDIAWKAVRGIGNGQLLDENFLMTLATVGAFVLGILQTGDYTEAVMVMRSVRASMISAALVSMLAQSSTTAGWSL